MSSYSKLLIYSHKSYQNAKEEKTEKVTYTNTFFIVELDANYNGEIKSNSKLIVFSELL